MTFAELLLGERTQYVWVGWVVAPGIQLLVAEDEIQIGTHLHKGSMVVERAPGLDADPYTGRASAGSCRIRLKADIEDPRVSGSTRTMDLEAVAGVPWTDATVSLRLYAIDPDRTPFQAANGTGVYGDPRGSYKVDSYQIEGNGDLVLDCVGLAERYNVKLPKYIIEKKTWANVYSEDKGRKGPILYGTFTDLEAPQVDTTTDKVLVACHHIKTRVQSRLDDKPTPSTLSNTTDTKGRAVALFDFDGDLQEGRCDASGTGHGDDAYGTYTGTASALISHPADQLHHFARVFAEIPADRVDVPSFLNLRAALPGWAWSLMLTADDDKSFFDAVQPTARLLRCAVLFERDKLRVTRCNLTAPSVLTLTNGENCEDVTISSGDEGRIINSVTLRYNYGWRKKRLLYDFREVAQLDDADHAGAAASLARHGLRREEIRAREIIGDATGDAIAYYVAMSLLDLAAPRRRVAECVAGPESHLLRIYDVLTLVTDKMPSTTGGTSSARWVVTGIDYGLRENRLKLLEA